MPLPVIASTCRITVRGNLAAGPHWQNTWHAKVTTGTWDATQIAAFHAIFGKIYIGPVVGAGGGGWVSRLASPGNVVDTVYTPLDGASASTILPLALAGSGGGDALPPSVALVVTIRTALRGRQNRGRIYFPASTEADNDGTGRCSTAVANGITLQVRDVNAALITAGFNLGVASYGPYIPPAPPLPLPVPHFTPATTFTFDTIWDSQRRRKT